MSCRTGGPFRLPRLCLPNDDEPLRTHFFLRPAALHSSTYLFSRLQTGFPRMYSREPAGIRCSPAHGGSAAAIHPTSCVSSAVRQYTATILRIDTLNPGHVSESSQHQQATPWQMLYCSSFMQRWILYCVHTPVPVPSRALSTSPFSRGQFADSCLIRCAFSYPKSQRPFRISNEVSKRYFDDTVFVRRQFPPPGCVRSTCSTSRERHPPRNTRAGAPRLRVFR